MPGTMPAIVDSPAREGAQDRSGSSTAHQSSFAIPSERSPGHVLSNGIDANGRMIGFVYSGDPPGPDGSDVFVDEALVDRSANARLLAQGHAYPAFYATLPASLRAHFSGLSRTARAAPAAARPVAALHCGSQRRRAGRRPGRARAAGDLAEALSPDRPLSGRGLSRFRRL